MYFFKMFGQPYKSQCHAPVYKQYYLKAQNTKNYNYPTNNIQQIH